MTDPNSILSRMVRVPTPTEAPMSSARAVGIAVSRAADRAVGLRLTVTDVAQSTGGLDLLDGGLSDTHILIRLRRGDTTVGVMAVDPQMRAAAIEIQTMGRVSNAMAVERAPTGTDFMMLDPLINNVLLHLAQLPLQDDLSGWVDQITVAGVFDDLRATKLGLEDGVYQCVQIDLDLVPDQRKGKIMICLPQPDHAHVVAVADGDHIAWDVMMRATVNKAPATLLAQLHRLPMSLRQVKAMKQGDVIPLSGANVGSVQLYAPGGVAIGKARLGQAGGMRAVRLETPAPLVIRDLPKPVTAG